VASSSHDLEELPFIELTAPPYAVPLRLQTFLEFQSGKYYYCGDHVTYCFEHLFKEASDDFLDFIQYSDTTVPTPRPLYLTRTEGTQRLVEYLTAQQAAREPREPRPLVPDSSDDDSTTPVAPRRPPSPPTPPDQPLPVPTPPPVMSNVAKSGLKANKPTEFTGSYTKSEEFLQECETYIDLTEPSASDRAKIAFILTYLKGPAPSAWKRQYIISTNNRSDTFDEFKARFNAAYGDPNKKSNALTKLERLFQGKCPFEQYLANFLILKAKTGLQDESYLIRRLVNGLNERLRLKTMTMGKSTWNLEKHIEELREWETSHNNYQGFTPFQPKHSSSQGTPMDVDKKKSTTVRTQNLPKLTPQLRNELRKKGACFRCRKPGHMSRECPSPDSTLVSTSSSKTTSNKGKNHREVVEEIDEEKADESEEEEQPKKQEKKKVKKAKATSSIASSSRTPVTIRLNR